ncbi:hypothetical protein E2C01_056594 [Portunus trituberculatus]|uniref:Uncharacterized protein n=1 Tax=Portunus trituberculatus TaxID=210409 RepID=A0A5B7GY41_PORTR|nr:hypothetical protein [Portunus trituberculatus]
MSQIWHRGEERFVSKNQRTFHKVSQCPLSRPRNTITTTTTTCRHSPALADGMYRFYEQVPVQQSPIKTREAGTC